MLSRKRRVVSSIESVPHASALSSVMRRFAGEELKAGGSYHGGRDFQSVVVLHDVKSDIRVKIEQDDTKPTVIVTTAFLFDKWLSSVLDFSMEKLRGQDKYFIRHNNQQTTDNEQYLLLDSLWRMVEKNDWGIRYDMDGKDKLRETRGQNSSANFCSRRYSSLACSKKHEREYKQYFKERDKAYYEKNTEWKHNEKFDTMVLHEVRNLVAMAYGVDEEYNEVSKEIIEKQIETDRLGGYYSNGGFGENLSHRHTLCHSALVAEILELKRVLNNPSYKKGVYKIKEVTNA